jgi:superfamily II RNA helicase
MDAFLDLEAELGIDQPESSDSEIWGDEAPAVDQLNEEFLRVQQEVVSDEVLPGFLMSNLSSKRHYGFEIPSCCHYLLNLEISDEQPVKGFSFDYAELVLDYKIKRVDNKGKSSQIKPNHNSIATISDEELEAILNADVTQPQPSSIQFATEILDGRIFNPARHPLYSLVYESQVPKPQDSQLSDSKPGEEPGEVKEEYAIVQKTKNVNFAAKVPEPAIIFPFELDDFQKRAIICVEQNQNVFVAAHTSAGKTVIADYAIALCKHRKSRVIYTSPIKALSNQKYRDFKKVFKEVGIMTGDVNIDSEAPCLVMTTEVLRSMLYKGSDKLRDLEWVILDEVHYINDAERGVVWEEVLILLPSHVRIIMLSATVPNYKEFCEWVGKIRRQPVYIQFTRKRPVPLKHSFYIDKDIITLVDASGKAFFDVYDKVLREKLSGGTAGGNIRGGSNVRGGFNGRGDRGRADRGRGRGRGKAGKNKKWKVSEDFKYKELVNKLKDGGLVPCILFCFSRDKCDKRAEKLKSVDLLSDSEKNIVKLYFQRAIKRLEPIDRELPQVLFVRELLERGLGVHHSGILPILKEIVEILFSKGLVKVLAATETVAIGLNLPTRSVVFCDMRKFDGSEWRDLQPGEYTQMSGRAGRRGKDTEGNVIIFITNPEKALKTDRLRAILKNQPLQLESKFRVRYNQITSILMTNFMSLEELVAKSFLENTKTFSESLIRDVPKISETQEVSSRIKILQHFGFIDENRIVQLKGRVLAEINNPYNLIIVQALFEGLFSTITPEELAAAVSVFVCEANGGLNWDIDTEAPDLANSLYEVEAICENVIGLETSNQVNIEIDTQNLVKATLVEVVYKWAKGMAFIELCGLTHVKEGNIVRTIIRVNEMLGYLERAAFILDDKTLKDKAKKASQLIKRDIAFAASLYLSK